MTYELVQRLLLIGKMTSHATPTAIAAAPARASSAALRAGAALLPIQRPATMPSSVVAMAGNVLSSPSGSHLGFQRWPDISARSMNAPRFPSGDRSPAVPPGAGASIITAQYPSISA